LATFAGRLVVVVALGVFWRVTRTASRTLRRPPRADGTFRGPFVRRRLLSDWFGRCVGGFLAGDEDRLTNPTKPPPRGWYVPRSFCSATFAERLVVVVALGVFWRVTRTASRTLRSPPPRVWKKRPSLFFHANRFLEPVLDIAKAL